MKPSEYPRDLENGQWLEVQQLLPGGGEAVPPTGEGRR